MDNYKERLLKKYKKGDSEFSTKDFEELSSRKRKKFQKDKKEIYETESDQDPVKINEDAYQKIFEDKTKEEMLKKIIVLEIDNLQKEKMIDKMKYHIVNIESQLEELLAKK